MLIGVLSANLKSETDLRSNSLFSNFLMCLMVKKKASVLKEAFDYFEKILAF
jgi:F0F1-type ATP synthase delta subunit